MVEITDYSVKARVYSRAALIGNPSDGYYGKTIALPLPKFYAEVELEDSFSISILPSAEDMPVYDDLNHLVDHVSIRGYYGGLRLMKAAIICFLRYCHQQEIHVEERPFDLRYQSNIPIRLGLAGSSALVIACLKALCAFYEVEIPPEILANVALEAELKELGIAAGLQDRVVQSFNELVYMDFDAELMQKQGYGKYEILPKENLPFLFIGYQSGLAEGSEVVHGNLRERFDVGEEAVLAAIERWKGLTDQAREAILVGDGSLLGEWMDDNFDIRASLGLVNESNRKMVEKIRELGAHAKFTGSGGAIIGTCEAGEFERIQSVLLQDQIVCEAV